MSLSNAGEMEFPSVAVNSLLFVLFTAGIFSLPFLSGAGAELIGVSALEWFKSSLTLLFIAFSNTFVLLALCERFSGTVDSASRAFGILLAAQLLCYVGALLITVLMLSGVSSLIMIAGLMATVAPVTSLIVLIGSLGLAFGTAFSEIGLFRTLVVLVLGTIIVWVLNYIVLYLLSYVTQFFA